MNNYYQIIHETNYTSNLLYYVPILTIENIFSRFSMKIRRRERKRKGNKITRKGKMFKTEYYIAHIVKSLSMHFSRLWNTHITTRIPHNSLRILERPTSFAKLITLMNAVARGASFKRERRGQERHLHEARPHVNSWVRIRSRLRSRYWDIWCSSHLLRHRNEGKRGVPATRIGTNPLENQRERKERRKGKRKEEMWSFVLAKYRRLSFAIRGGRSQREYSLSSRRCFWRNMQNHTRVCRPNAVARCEKASARVLCRHAHPILRIL